MIAPLPTTLTDEECNLFSKLLLQETGIALDKTRQSFLSSRLAKRLPILNLSSYGDYYRLISQPENKAERLRVLDLLTTHETWFFREEKHFEKLRAKALEHRGSRPFRVWSAACASGEEAHSAAMVLADVFGPASQRWELVASDISLSGLEIARHGCYPLARAKPIPHPLIRKFCLKGIHSQDGKFLVSRQLRLFKALPDLPLFDIIFLRNTLIYFKPTARKHILRAIEPLIALEGFLFVSHTESLQGLDAHFALVQPGIYRKMEATP